jgi:DNA-binding HxlR family transcriptional regulator
MEKNGLIRRTVYDETPLKVEHFLTEKGLSMKPILDQMAAFFP